MVLKNPTLEYAYKLLGIIEHFDLLDIWRVRNPEAKKYTWINKTRSGIVQSRIDYFLVSTSISNIVKKVDITPGIRSDHSMLCLLLDPDSPEKRGKGFWKFNASLLKDKKYVDLVRKSIEETNKESGNLVDKGLLWDLTKCHIRGLSVSYSVRKRRLDNAHENSLLKRIEENEKLLADGNEDVMQELDSLKSEYDDVQNEKAQGIIIRSKAKCVEYGEKNTKFFLQLEKRNHDVKHIKSLITENGTVTNPKCILEVEKQFYSKLYTEQRDTYCDDQTNMFLHNASVRTISSDTNNICEGTLTLTECQKALQDMSNNKTPGNDGFTVEFYKYFWDDIKTLVLDSFNYAFEKGSLSVEQKRGVITLIPKKDKDARYIKNWRPITLLNTDYKILTKVLSNRLQIALKEIISPDQTGYIKGRYIGENIRVIDDIIRYTSIHNVSGYILSLDFEKSF